MAMFPTISHDDEVTRAARIAIARARRRGSPHVNADDLLGGLLLAASRFGIVLIGPWTIDMDDIGGEPLDEPQGGPKPAYTDEVAQLFAEAAAVARRDGAPHVEIVHMLVAFADASNELMTHLRDVHGIDSRSWRASLARWRPTWLEDDETGGPVAAAAGNVRELLSPDEAAEFLGVHTQTVRGYMRSGKLPAHRLAGERVLRIQRQDLLALLEPYHAEQGPGHAQHGSSS